MGEKADLTGEAKGFLSLAATKAGESKEVGLVSGGTSPPASASPNIWKAPPCWVCGRPKKGKWHSAWDLTQQYPLCWFCVGEVNNRFCDYNHEKCGWWKDYTCTRQIGLEEMKRLRDEIRWDRAGGFKFVKDGTLEDFLE